ncbi:Cro/CI family transcriptional regulator, partial [Elstera litoralis]
MNELKSYFSRNRGERVRIAAALDISPAALSQWDRVPSGRVLDIERLTGISR